MTTLSLVIPAYNEEERLAALFDELRANAAEIATGFGMDLIEAIVSDDGSTDATAQLLAEAQRDWTLLRLVPGTKVNQGKGAAIRAGVGLATGEYVLFADVDLSTPLAELGGLVAAIEDGADVAVGSRDIEGALVERGPRHRKVMGRAFNRIVRLVTALPIHDTQCGFKLMKTEVARQLLQEQQCPGFAFDVELLVRAQIAGLRIAEVPVRYVHDSGSRVDVVSAGPRMLLDVLSVSYRLRPRNRVVEPRKASPETARM